MSKPNGSRPIERLAEALQDCLDDAVERGAKRATEAIRDEFGPRFDKMDGRLDKQDETLRMIWRQRGGDENKHLPIDD